MRSIKHNKFKKNSPCNVLTAGIELHPVICPSIIVAVRRGKEILLANHKRHYHPNGGMYTTLAGFVEVGETFEQAVRREVFEETGILIKIFVILVASLGHSRILKWSVPG